MKNSNTFDVIIIGGGIAGLSAGYFLSSKAKIVILESENECGLHATGKSFKGLTYEYNSSSINDLVKDSIHFLKDRQSASQNILYKRGMLILGKESDEDRLLNEIKQAKALNIDLTLLDLHDIRQHIGFLNPIYLKAVFDPFVFDLNVTTLQSLYINKVLEKNHINLCETVSRLQYQKHVWLVTTNKNTYQAPIIINAGGAWSNNIAKLAGLSCPLSSFSRTIYISDVKTENSTWDWPVVRKITTNLIFKPNSCSNFIISPCEEVMREPGIPTANAELIKQTKKDFQDITGLKLSAACKKWAGLRTFSQDKLPIMGFDPRAQGFFWLTCLGGFGNKISPSLGKLTADLIFYQNRFVKPEKLICDPSLFSPSRFLQ